MASSLSISPQRMAVAILILLSIAGILLQPGLLSYWLDRGRSEYHFSTGSSCARLLNLGHWTGRTALPCAEAGPEAAVCGNAPAQEWLWSQQALNCGAHRFDQPALQELLRATWLAMAGDSIARSLFAALLRLFEGASNTESSGVLERRVVFGHQSFEFMLPGSIRASFFWAPYADNVTAHIKHWVHNGTVPGVLVAGTALWHVLHIHDPVLYEEGLVQLAAAAQLFPTHTPAYFLSTSQVTHSKLKSAEKKRWMTTDRLRRYNAAIAHSSLLAPAGPFGLVDMQRLTYGCGAACTEDGIHYSNSTYDAALQIWANALELSLRERNGMVPSVSSGLL